MITRSNFIKTLCLAITALFTVRIEVKKPAKRFKLVSQVHDSYVYEETHDGTGETIEEIQGRCMDSFLSDEHYCRTVRHNSCEVLPWPS